MSNCVQTYYCQYILYHRPLREKFKLGGIKEQQKPANPQEQRREADTTPKIVDWNEHMRMTSRQFGRWKQVLTSLQMSVAVLKPH